MSSLFYYSYLADLTIEELIEIDASVSENQEEVYLWVRKGYNNQIQRLPSGSSKPSVLFINHFKNV